MKKWPFDALSTPVAIILVHIPHESHHCYCLYCAVENEIMPCDDAIVGLKFIRDTCEMQDFANCDSIYCDECEKVCIVAFQKWDGVKWSDKRLEEFENYKENVDFFIFIEGVIRRSLNFPKMEGFIHLSNRV